MVNLDKVNTYTPVEDGGLPGFLRDKGRKTREGE